MCLRLFASFDSTGATRSDQGFGIKQLASVNRWLARRLRGIFCVGCRRVRPLRSLHPDWSHRRVPGCDLCQLQFGDPTCKGHPDCRYCWFRAQDILWHQDFG